LGDGEQSPILKYILSGVELLLLMIQIYIEWLQLDEVSLSGLKGYFESFWNVLDVVQYGTTVWIVVSNL